MPNFQLEIRLFSPEVVLPVGLEVECVELWDGAPSDLDPVGALAAQPRLHLVGQDGRGLLGPAPAEGHPVVADLLHLDKVVCKKQRIFFR